MRQLNGLMFVCMVTAKQLMSTGIFPITRFCRSIPLCAGTDNLKVELQQEQPWARSWSSRFSVFPEQEESSVNGSRRLRRLHRTHPAVTRSGEFSSDRPGPTWKAPKSGAQDTRAPNASRLPNVTEFREASGLQRVHRRVGAAPRVLVGVLTTYAAAAHPPQIRTLPK